MAIQPGTRMSDSISRLKFAADSGVNIRRALPVMVSSWNGLNVRDGDNAYMCAPFEYMFVAVNDSCNAYTW